MTKILNQIDLISTGLMDSEGEHLFTVTGELPLLRITGEIMLYSDKDQIFMGDFYAKNLIDNKEYNAYWFRPPSEIFSDINFLRGKNYDALTSNSPIALVIKVKTTDKFHPRRWVYTIDSLTNLDR